MAAKTPGCGAVPRRLPSLTGTDAELLDEYIPPLPSRQRVYQQVAEVLNEIEKSSDPVLVMLVAEWGEGKTSIYNARIKPWAEKNKWLTLETRAATVAAHLASLRQRAERDPAFRLTAALLAAGLEASGLLAKYGPPDAAPSLREYVENVLGFLAEGRRGVIVFIDEFEDLVASASEEELGLLVAGLVGLLNGDVELVSARCRRENCLRGMFHVVVSLTPPAYSRLMSLRDFATIAARLKRRVRTIWVQPLTRREAFAFLESLARYSLGEGLDSLLIDRGLANALVSSSLGNMGALVSAFRYLVSWSRGRRGCGDAVAILDTAELIEALENLRLSVGGAEIPAINAEAYTRLIDGWEARAKLAGLDPARARRLLDELVARGAATWQQLVEATNMRRELVAEAVRELNMYGEQAWPRRELGVQRLVHEVVLVPAVEDAFKLLRGAEPEIAKLMPQLAPRDDVRPLEQLLDSLVYLDQAGRLVVAVPPSEEDAASLVADASPLELSRFEAERLASLLWENIFSKLVGVGGEKALLLSPKMQRVIYVSPELHYLDFIADRVERLRIIRRVYTEAGRQHMLLGLSLILAHEGLLEGEPATQGDGVARITARVAGETSARILVYAIPGQVTGAEAKRLESQLLTAIMSHWRPHAILLVYHGGVEPQADRVLEALEAKFFVKIVKAPIDSMMTRVRLQALGIKLSDTYGGVEEALRAARKIVVESSEAEAAGLDPLRLANLLRELGEELRLKERLLRGLEEGIDGAPLLVGDPMLGYDVEKPTELSGALRYFLVAPSTKTTVHEALNAAYEYVMRYHLYRGQGGEGRGILSPDIDRNEYTTLERYMTLLVANKFLERTNGSVYIDTLSPLEKAVLRALEQLDARSKEVQAAQIWDVLVVAARNPGTRRMLLQSLLYRGLITSSSGSARRIDADRMKIRLTDSDEDAWRLIEEAKKLVEEIEADPVTASWGLVVSAKARDFRAGSLEAFVAKSRRLLGVALEALRAGNRLMSLRLARLVYDTASYVKEEVLEAHVHHAVEDARRLRSRIEEEARRIRELVSALNEQLSTLLGGVKTNIDVQVLSKLEEALKVFSEIDELRISEEELEKEVMKLWEDVKKKHPRDPGRYTPFYVNGLGPLLHFNYKLWMLYSRLEDLGIVRLGQSGAEPSKEVESVTARLESLLESTRRIMEDTAETRRLAEKLSEKLERLGVRVPPEALALPGFEHSSIAERLGIEEAEQLVKALRRSLEDARRPLVELDEQVSRLLDELAGLEDELVSTNSWAKALEKILEDARAAGLPQTTMLGEVLGDVRSAIAQAQDMRKRAIDGLRGKEPQELLEAVRGARSLVESARTIIRDSLDRGQRVLRDVEAEARRILASLEAEAEALEEALRAIGQEPSRPRRGANVFEDILAVRRYLEELRRMIEEAGILGEDELRAYREVVAERRRRGELLFREAVVLVSERLGIGQDAARKLLISLIEKGILEPRI
jgi:hypothetical protein